MDSRVRARGLVTVAAVAAIAATLAGAGDATIKSAPTNQTAPHVSASDSVQGTVVSTNSGSWAGSGITFSYKWENCTDNTTATCTDIPSATGTTYELQDTDVGDYVRSYVTATNSDGATSAYSSNAIGPVTAATAPSSGALPAITGARPPSVGRTLTADRGTWGGTTPITYAYQWQLCDSGGNNCNNISDTGTTYVVTSNDVGKTLRVEVTATNVAGFDQEESAATDVVVIGTPLNTALPVVSGIDTTGSKLTTTNGTWLGSTPITYTYVWKRCDTNGNNCSAISGATANNYTLTSSDSAHDVRSAVTATNTAGSSTATSAATSSVASGAPVNTVAPAVSGSTVVGQNLAVTNGTWTGITPINYTYQWLRCDANGNNCASIASATRTSYTLVTADLGAKLVAHVVATNSAGTLTATSNIVGPITSNAPVNTVAPALSGTLTIGQNLNVTTGTWTGQSPINYTYQWQRCNATAAVCTPIFGANRSQYLLQTADASAYIRVTVTASNHSGNTAINSNLIGPVQSPLPKGARRLPNGAISVPVMSLPTTDVLRITSFKVTPATIKHRKLVRITLKVIDQHAYVINGAKVTITAAHPTWITRVSTRITPPTGLVTITISPTLKAPLRGTLVLRIRALPSHGTSPSSSVKTVKITMRA